MDVFSRIMKECNIQPRPHIYVSRFLTEQHKVQSPVGKPRSYRAADPAEVHPDHDPTLENKPDHYPDVKKNRIEPTKLLPGPEPT